MSDSGALDELYKQVILDHYRSPRNRGELSAPAVRAVGHNPLCGDEVIVSLVIDNDQMITDIMVSGSGCSISQSAASMMSVAVKGQTASAARETTRAFKEMMSVHEDSLETDNSNRSNIESAAPGHHLGDLEALRGVVKFPVRIKCALLSWNTLLEAIDSAGNSDL